MAARSLPPHQIRLPYGTTSHLQNPTSSMALRRPYGSLRPRSPVRPEAELDVVSQATASTTCSTRKPRKKTAPGGTPSPPASLGVARPPRLVTVFVGLRAVFLSVALAGHVLPATAWAPPDPAVENVDLSQTDLAFAAVIRSLIYGPPS